MIEFQPSEIADYYAARVPDLKQTGSHEWRGLCPIHGGKHQNFAVKSDTGCWFCHSACQRGGDIIALEREITNADFKDARDEVFRIVGRNEYTNDAGSTKRARWRTVTTYVYRDEAKIPLFKVVRRERGQGEKWEKAFHIERFESGVWIKGLKQTRRVPYRLNEVVLADQVFIVEGEKDADTMAAWGLVGTTCPLGAGRWAAEFSPYFAGKHAIILADNDDVGREHALQVATELLPLAATVRILELPNLPPKGDVTDWKCAGGSRDRLLELTERTESLTQTALEQLIKRWAPEPIQDVNDQTRPPAKSFPFQVRDEGIFFLKENDHGTVDAVRVAARVEVLAKTRDHASLNWGRLLRWQDDEGKDHEWAVPAERLVLDVGGVCARLLSEGIPFIATSSRLRERLIEYLQTSPVVDKVRCVARVGWHESVYVLPDCTISPEGSEKVLYQAAHDAVHHWNTCGDLSAWREQVGRKCSGNSRLIIAVSTGFAGPLLSLACVESGGLHFQGGSSIGKTTALVVGGSVCGGGGKDGFLQSWRTTINGLEGIAEAHNDGTLFLDELAQVDATQAAATAYLLGNGQGKGRMTRTCGTRQRLRWNILFVSTGETTLAEHVGSAGKSVRGGAEVRLLNIAADAGQGLGLFENLHGSPSADVFSREMRESALRLYGSPFRTFLEILTRKRTEVEDLVRNTQEGFIDRFVPLGASGEVKRAAGRFGLIAAAGELATEWELTGWQPGEAINAAERCFLEWVGGRGTCGASDMEAAIRQVRAFLESNGSSRFQSLSPGDVESSSECIFNRAGFTRSNEDGETEYIILPEVFKAEVCKGYSHSAVLKELAKRGFLEREMPNMSIKRQLPELGKIRVYCVRAAVLDGAEC